MVVGHREVKSLIVKSHLPASDYCVNPYIGCPHGCKYCYASFMRRFTGHEEAWGDFIDIKESPPVARPEKYAGSSFAVGSVTDAYNPFEATFCKTRGFLAQFAALPANKQPVFVIPTKSALVARDIDLLQRLSVTVAFSMNTLDEGFCADMEGGSSIAERLGAMRQLHEAGIKTAAFISPIFPGLTSVQAIVEATRSFCDQYWLENLNLRGSSRRLVLDYIAHKEPHLLGLYQSLYTGGGSYAGKKSKSVWRDYWEQLSLELMVYAEEQGLDVINYFYHELIRK